MDQGDLVGSRVCASLERAGTLQEARPSLRCTMAGIGAGRESRVPMSRNVEQ
jgi:hypothetical protein